MSRRKQTKPSPLEDYEMESEKLRTQAKYMESQDEERSPQNDWETHSGNLAKGKKSTMEPPRTSLLELMKKHITVKRQRDVQQDNDEETVVPYKLHQELHNSYIMLKKRLKEKDVVITEKDTVIRKLSEKCERISTELEKIRQLNICLQEQLFLKKGGSHKAQSFPTPNTESLCESTVVALKVKKIKEAPPDDTTEKEFEMVDLGHGVHLDKQKWKAIQRLDSHSKFCKSLAVATWGIETLRERSVTGSKSNAIKGSVAKPPLSPEKVGVIRGCLKERLYQRGYQKEAIDGQLRLVRRFLSEKICDIKRKVHSNSETTSMKISDGMEPFEPVVRT